MYYNTKRTSVVSHRFMASRKETRVNHINETVVDAVFYENFKVSEHLQYFQL